MADWSLLDREWLPAPPPAPYDPFQYADYDPYYLEKQQQQLPVQFPPPPAQQPQPSFTPPSPTLTVMMTSPRHVSPMPLPVLPMPYVPPIPRGDNPREIRNKAEKQRRDKLNHSIAELASMVPPVVAASRKIDKTGVLRLTAHYLRAHQYVFGDSITQTTQFSQSSTKALLGLLNGFLLTTTYKGLVVVVSQNVSEVLGYSELDLLGQNIFNLTHEDDRKILKDNLMPRSQKLGTNGELLVPEDAEGKRRVANALANEKRRFVIRFKKHGQRSEPSKYVTCHVEGSLRKSDRACRAYNRCCQMVRRARARGDNPCSSGNDVVFIGVVRPTTETFIRESAMESYKMEYRTRHSIDGEIIQCEQKIALVTGYMTHEVNGVNAMNFIHRDEVRWVIVALREMYDHNLVFGESCYRLITKNGQFVYMRTRGRLDVDKDSRVTSFVCTNTLVDEREGKHLIKLMKERFAVTENNNVSPALDKDETVPVEDPRQLEKVIMSLVTNLPSPQSSPAPLSPDQPSTSVRLAIIPPRRERIVSAIEKIYTVIKQIPKQPSILELADDEPDIVVSIPLQHTYTQETIGNATPIFEQSSSLLQSDDAAQYHEQMKFQMLPPQDMAGLFEAGPSGVTYPKSYVEDANGMIIATDEQAPGRSTPSLEAFFDEAVLNTQIESAIDSLEQAMDPNFPDLLISNEVQEILGQIEDADMNA